MKTRSKKAQCRGHLEIIAYGNSHHIERVTELVEAGVKRISIAASFYRAAMTGLMGAAQEARNNGTFSFVDRAMLTAGLNRYCPD